MEVNDWGGPCSLLSPKCSCKQSPEPAQASPDPIVGGSDHPVLADEGAPAELEAGVVLEEDGKGQCWLDTSSPQPG